MPESSINIPTASSSGDKISNSEISILVYSAGLKYGTEIKSNPYVFCVYLTGDAAHALT